MNKDDLSGLGGDVKLNLFAAAVLSTALSTSAFAGQRYMVVMKNHQTLKQAMVSFSNPMQWGSSATNVEASLEHINTLVVETTPAEAAKFQLNPDVMLVEKEVFHAGPKPVKGFLFGKNSGSKKKLTGEKTPWGILAVKAPQAWKAAKQGKQGEGARVLILDTGIDQNHPSLKANIEKGQDFTDLSDGSDFSDTQGHGTHVAGTIAGIVDKDGFAGVAPKAKILAGRVCGDEGCSNIAVAAGINWGVEEKVDVISMSLGGPWSTPGERNAVEAADKAGVTVVAASGNSGTAQVSYPAALPTVIAVGAVDVTLKKADFSQWGPELAVMGPGVDVVSSVPMGLGRESQVMVTMAGKTERVISAAFQGAKELETALAADLVYVGLGKVEDFAKVDVTGKLALIARGEIRFSEKVENAMKAKAAGVIVYNNAPGLIRAGLTEDGSVLDIGAAMIEQSVGEALKAELAKGGVASASLLTLKTDYASFDGTSMATPHVSGVVALVKAANKNLTPQEVKAILTSTAQALGPNEENQYGAGIVNAYSAVRAALAK